MSTWEKLFNLSNEFFDELRFEISPEIHLVNRFYRARHKGINLRPGCLIKINKGWASIPNFTSSHHAHQNNFPAGYFPTKDNFICMYLEEYFGFWFSEAVFEDAEEVEVSSVAHDYIVKAIAPEIGPVCFSLGQTINAEEASPDVMYKQALIDFEQRFTIVQK